MNIPPDPSILDQYYDFTPVDSPDDIDPELLEDYEYIYSAHFYNGTDPKIDFRIWWIYPVADYEAGNPNFRIYRMSWFTPVLDLDYAIWYIANFYVTVVGFIFEFLLLLAMFSSILKKNSGLRSYYYTLTFIIGLFDMTRFFVPADYGYSPSFFFSRGFANNLRHFHMIYGFFMSSFVPICQLTLTMNRLTAVIMPIKHNNIWNRRRSTIIILFVIAIPLIITLPYALCQNVSYYRPMIFFSFITIGQYLKIAVLTGIAIASIATMTGIYILVRFFIVAKKSVNIAFEIRLLFVVMISNIGCIAYNICQVFLYKAYLNKNIQNDDLVVSTTVFFAVYFYDELSKSVLIFHHYTSFIILICMRNTVVIARTFEIEPEFEYDSEVNCTEINKKAVLQCINYILPTDLEVYGLANGTCNGVVQFFNCVSAIHDVRCFNPDNYADYWNSHKTDYDWTNTWMDINLCRNSSTEDLAEIGCLFWKQLYYPQHCGIMELDNCEKKLESVRCRMRYVQSVCNTATAMKLCENYLIEKDHCFDVVAECRNTTFEKNKGSLPRGYQEYIDSFYNDVEDPNDYGNSFIY
ncbi:hypothetical protein FO519_008900 [Halicephalobus sp. NKZ332]|nr:hypothetical protein FO519_008900 [Halicephalobus sp. NKZ332]